jgi:hypothetical protein
MKEISKPCLLLKGKVTRRDDHITRKLKKVLIALPSKHPFSFHPGCSASDFRETQLAVLQCEVCSNNVRIFLRISFKGMGNRKDPQYNRRRYNRRAVYVEYTYVHICEDRGEILREDGTNGAYVKSERT